MDKNQKILLGAIIVVVLAMAVFLYPGDTGTTSCTPATKENGRFDVDNDGKVNFQDSGLIWVHRTVEENGESTGEIYDMIYDMDCDGDVDWDDSNLCFENRD